MLPPPPPVSSAYVCICCNVVETNHSPLSSYSCARYPLVNNVFLNCKNDFVDCCKSFPICFVEILLITGTRVYETSVKESGGRPNVFAIASIIDISSDSEMVKTPSTKTGSVIPPNETSNLISMMVFNSMYSSTVPVPPPPPPPPPVEVVCTFINLMRSGTFNVRVMEFAVNVVIC